jgi:hypothetical protein
LVSSLLKRVRKLKLPKKKRVFLLDGAVEIGSLREEEL